jgi:hypothetical protein
MNFIFLSKTVLTDGFHQYILLHLYKVYIAVLTDEFHQQIGCADSAMVTGACPFPGRDPRFPNEKARRRVAI